MTPEEVNIIRKKQEDFYNLDNDEKSAQDYAEWVLANMDLFWRGRLVQVYLDYLRMSQAIHDPRQCVKSLRVLHEVTTHCTKVDVKRLVMTTNILVLMRDILHNPKIRDNVVRNVLTLLSNLMLCGWRIRDAVEESGVLSELLQLVRSSGNKSLKKQKPLLGQIIWLLYQFLKYKVPGPAVSAVEEIADAIAGLLAFNTDVDLLLPLLKITRLMSEYHSVKDVVMIEGGIFKKVLRFVLSPLPEIQREATMILAHTCQLHYAQKKHGLYKFPGDLFSYLHGLILGGRTDIRIMVLNLICGIIDNRCVRPSMMLNLVGRIMWCSTKHESVPEVRLAASWTLASFAMHLEGTYLPHFIEMGGLQAVCQVLHQQPKAPVQLVRNVLSVLLLILESYRPFKICLMHAMTECNLWHEIQELQGNPNVAIRTLAKLLTHRHAMEFCWLEVLNDERQ